MEESSFQAIYTGVYIVVFITALTVSLYLFNGITDLADKAYEYGNTVTGQTIIESPNIENLYYTDSDIISYYMNYVKNDKFATGSAPNELTHLSFNVSGVGNNLTYKDLVDKVKSKQFVLRITAADAFQINLKS